VTQPGGAGSQSVITMGWTFAVQEPAALPALLNCQTGKVRVPGTSVELDAHYNDPASPCIPAQPCAEHPASSLVTEPAKPQDSCTCSDRVREGDRVFKGSVRVVLASTGSASMTVQVEMDQGGRVEGLDVVMREVKLDALTPGSTEQFIGSHAWLEQQPVWQPQHLAAAARPGAGPAPACRAAGPRGSGGHPLGSSSKQQPSLAAGQPHLPSLAARAEQQPSPGAEQQQRPAPGAEQRQPPSPAARVEATAISCSSAGAAACSCRLSSSSSRLPCS